MATVTANIKVGAATISVGDYVTAGGAGSLTDVGHLKNPSTIQMTFEDYAVKSERAFGTLKRVPQDAEIKLKVSMSEAVLEHYRIATRQPSANLTGTPPDLTLLIGDPAEQYHQIQLVAPGVGTTKVRTVTLWRCFPESLAEIPFAKGAEQLIEVTFACLYDDSVATADKFGKIVDA